MKARFRGSTAFLSELAVLLTIIAVIGVACNLGAAATTPTPLASPTSAQPPTISIQAPQNNADAVVGQPITVQATANHPDGVTRIELQVNSQIVDSKVSQNPLGDQQFSAYLNYTPRTPGSLILQVVAYRASVPSLPAVVTVNVKVTAAQVTATVAQPAGSDDSSSDQTSYDPTCRARVEVNGLNYRQGPAQTFDRLQILSLGTIVPLTGRLADNTWWQGIIGNTVGWMSASFITLLGNCGAIQPLASPPTPIPTAQIPTISPPVSVSTGTPGLPDLIVSSINGPVSIMLDTTGQQTATYTILVQNVGTIPAISFHVGLVLPNGTLRDLGIVPALAITQQAQLQATVTFTAPGSARLIVLADSTNALAESDKTNNLRALDVVVIKPTPIAPTQAG